MEKPTVIAEIDGAKDPGAIPDVVAYRHFFGVLARTPNRSLAEDDARRRSYLKFYFHSECGDQKNDGRTLNDAQMDRLVSLADELETTLRPIQESMTALRSAGESAMNPASPELVSLRQRKDEAVGRAMVSIATVVDSDAAEKVRRHVLEHVKAHIKMVTIRMPVH